MASIIADDRMTVEVSAVRGEDSEQFSPFC